MDLFAFAKTRPVLYHLTREDAWKPIMKHGLHCAHSLVTLDRGEESATKLLTERRTGPEQLGPNAYGAVLRDQDPISDAMLDQCLALTETTRAQWFDLINRRSYLFARDADLVKMRNRYVNAGETVDVMEVKTQNWLFFLQTRKVPVEVATVSASSTPRTPSPRGPSTWTPLSTYADRPATVNEVTTVGVAPLDGKYVGRVVRYSKDAEPREIWPSAG